MSRAHGDLLVDLREGVRIRVRTGFPLWLRLVLWSEVKGITLGRRIYLAEGIEGGALDRLLRHELEHARQIDRIGLATFLFRYLREYFAGRLAGLSHRSAYYGISFEKEAREAERV